MSRAEDLLLLMTCGLAIGACEPAVDPDDDGGGGSNGDSVDDAVAACRPYAQQIVACFEQESPDEADYYAANYVTMVGYCVATLGYAQVSGDGCVAAYDDYFACLATVDCDAFIISDDTDVSDDGGGDGGQDVPAQYPCAAQEEAIEAACDHEGDEAEPQSGEG